MLLIQLHVVPIGQLSTATDTAPETYCAFNKDKYKVQAIPHVDWNGTRYWIGMSLKLIVWIKGHTFQFAISAAGGQNTKPPYFDTKRNTRLEHKDGLGEDGVKDIRKYIYVSTLYDSVRPLTSENF